MDQISQAQVQRVSEKRTPNVAKIFKSEKAKRVHPSRVAPTRAPKKPVKRPKNPRPIVSQPATINQPKKKKLTPKPPSTPKTPVSTTTKSTTTKTPKSKAKKSSLGTRVAPKPVTPKKVQVKPQTPVVATITPTTQARSAFSTPTASQRVSSTPTRINVQSASPTGSNYQTPVSSASGSLFVTPQSTLPMQAPSTRSRGTRVAPTPVHMPSYAWAASSPLSSTASATPQQVNVSPQSVVGSPPTTRKRASKFRLPGSGKKKEKGKK